MRHPEFSNKEDSGFFFQQSGMFQYLTERLKK